MKLSILVVLAALAILVGGFENPALFFIGYLWTSVLYPTAFATTVIPLSMTFGLFCLGSYFFINKKSTGGPLPVIFYLAILFAIWITVNTVFAQQHDDAWVKWNWAIQSVVITLMTPLFLRTRAQIETAFVATLTAFAAHAMTGGIKTMLGTGGYDRLGRLMMSNFWLGETSTLGMVAVISLPMAYYAVNKSVILEPYRGHWSRLVLVGYSVVAIMCMVGTSARTGLMAFGVLLLVGIKGIFRKAVVVLAAAGLYFFAQPYMPGKSLNRFSTISTYQDDSSAVVRLAVWEWARSYAAEHPFGGGFGIFNTNDIVYQMRDTDGNTVSQHRAGTAPHSIYFEVLGEQGYPGELLFVSMILGALWGTWRISRLKDAAGPRWEAVFARTLLVCLCIFIVGAAFVGIAFQPLLYVLLGFYCSIYRVAYSQGLSRKFSPQPNLYKPPREVPHEARA